MQQLWALIEEDPMKSLRQLAREPDVSPFLIRQAIHEDLRFFKIQHPHMQQRNGKSGASRTCT